MQPVRKYKYWDVYDELPPGYKIDDKTGSPLHGAVFITTGHRMEGGKLMPGKRALLIQPKKQQPCVS
jgi:hypothetical protein